jgi:hypothetical protein
VNIKGDFLAGVIPALSGAKLALAALAILGGLAFSAGTADAVVYCKTVGVQRGCVARPAGRPVVVAPARRPVVVAPAGRHVVYCRTRGVPRGCVMR